MESSKPHFIQLVAFRSYPGVSDVLLALDKSGQVWQLDYDANSPPRFVWRKKVAEIDNG